MSNFRLISLKAEITKEEDKDLAAFDHSHLSAINTCPTWGILRYGKHKKMPGSARSMALEAGSAAHEAFAAVRWFQYWKFQVGNTQSMIQRRSAAEQGVRLFGEDRFDRMTKVIDEVASTRTNTINFALEALESCDFYDDISDARRTISNISESIIAYIDAYDMTRYPIWVRDKTKADTDVGIEIPFDLTVSINWADHIEQSYSMKARFIGKMDGLHWNRDNLIIIEEKTGAKLDDHWLSQWVLSHQITGYCLAAATFTQESCKHALVSGMRIPIGKVPAEGIRREYVPRPAILFEKWANWFVTSIQMHETWENDVADAPMYTHSCNRYFNTCSFLPFCAADSREEKEQIIGEMETDRWSPLDVP